MNSPSRGFSLYYSCKRVLVSATCLAKEFKGSFHFLHIGGWLGGAKVSCIFCHPGRPADIG